MQNCEIVFLVEESDEGGFTAKAIHHSIYTHGDTIEELRTNLRDAVACHFDEGNRPSIIRLHIVRQEILAA
jgi:predicted RNase H-like HicB family nuclease